MGKIKMWSNKYRCFVAMLNGLIYYEDKGKRKKISAKTNKKIKRKVISKSLLWEKF